MDRRFATIKCSGDVAGQSSERSREPTRPRALRRLPFVLAFAAVGAVAVPGYAKDGVDPLISRFLERPLTTMRKGAVPGGFRVIVLSNVAEYCVNLQLAGRAEKGVTGRCLDRVVKASLARGISPYGGNIAKARLGNYGLYLSHLNVVLGAYRRGTGSDRYRPLNRRVSQHLRGRILAAKHRHLASYPSSRQRWPADQTVTLYSLYLYDRNYGAQLSAKPIADWLAYMKRRGTNKRWGLPVSEITGSVRTAKVPRGCALSFSIRYMAAFAKKEAKAQWRQYKKHYMTSLALAAGFREWPPGVNRKADDDSGPIVRGIGAAATGFALGASRAVGDMGTHGKLRSASAIVRAVGPKKLKKVGASILARSIEQNGLTIREWYPAK